MNYQQQARDWSYDRYYSQGIWLRRCLLSLVTVVLLLSMSLAGNLLLIPLKENVPYLYAFDHATGEITKIGKLESTTLSANWELTRYLLVHYVMNYESYDFDNLNLPYQLVWAQSADHVRSQYASLMKSDNKQSPYQRFSKDNYVTVRVISVNHLNENTVDVKFEKILHDRASHSEQVMQKEAIIRWEYQTAETSQQLLERDPLGFKVTYYQVSQVNIEINEGK